jgi:hypothetical protein
VLIIPSRDVYTLSHLNIFPVLRDAQCRNGCIWYYIGDLGHIIYLIPFAFPF